MHEIATKLLESKFPDLLPRFADAIQDVEQNQDDTVVVVAPEKIREIVSFLKENSNTRFDVMMDLFAIDYATFEPVRPQRFAVVYNLCSLFQKGRLFLKVYLPEGNPEVDSIHDLYAAANWFEREAFDLYGIIFRNHPNLVRILCHQDFEGHPLRKDYPSTQYQRLKNAAPSSGF